jgi:hypothetical protein
MYLDLSWHTGWYFNSDDRLRPDWSGFMQDISAGTFLAAADIRILPIIDFNPNDYSCIYSTLLFVQRQAKQLNIEVPAITFDQPLWHKAVDIVFNEKMKMVCRLGAFHTMMNYMGSIGSLRAGLGLNEALECCFGPNTVTQMLSGKAVAQGLRGHLLVDSALNIMLLKLLFGLSKQDGMQFDMLTSAEQAKVQKLYDEVVNGRCADEALGSSDCFQRLTSLLCSLRPICLACRGLPSYG